MTVQSQTSKVIYNGNGTTTAFSTNFSFILNNDVKVILVDNVGIETLQTISTHYSITGASTGLAGTVTMVTAPSTGQKLIIYRNPELTQLTDYVENDAFPAESHELALDKLTHIAQSLSEQISRSIKLPISSLGSPQLPSALASNALAWNDTATALINVPVSDIVNTFGGKTFKDFGVVGNGIADDTVALSNALNSGNTIFCNNEIIKFSKVTSNQPIKLVGKVTLQHDGSAITGTAALVFNETIQANHLVIRGNATDTVYDLLNTTSSSFFDVLELQSDAQRVNARGGYTNNGSHCRIGYLKTKNIARPHVTETTGDYLESLFIGGYEIDTYIRGIKTSRLEYANIGDGIIKNEWDGITATPGYNGILIEETRFLILGDQIIKDSAEHGLRIGGAGDGMTGFRIGNITTVNTGGCAVKLNVDPGALVRGGSVGDINGINCGRGSTAGNKEVCRITRARNVSIGVISGSESVTNLVTLADFDNIHIQGLRGDDVKKSYIKIDKGQDTSDGDGKNLYVGGVSGKSIGNRAVIEVDYAASGRSLENIVIDNVTVSDYTDYLATFTGTPTINGTFKITANLPSSAVVPKTENPPNISNYVVDITYGGRRYIGRGDTTDFTCGSNFGSGGTLDLSSSPDLTALGGVMSQSQTATAGDGVYGGSFIASRAGSSRRGAGVASKQIGANVYKQGLAILVQNAGITATDILTEIGLFKPTGILSLPLLPTYANEAAALAGGLVTGDIYKTVTGELRIKL